MSDKRFWLGRMLMLLAATWSPWSVIAHDSPVDHVDRALRIFVSEGKLYVRYQVQLSERSALMQLGTMDANRDGRVSEAERDKFFQAQSRELAGQLKLSLNGQAVVMKPEGAVAFLPQFKQVYVFVADGAKLGEGVQSGELVDHYSRNFPGSYRWDEPKNPVAMGLRVVVSEAPKVHGSDGHPSVLVVKFEVKN